jgi:hypothetical protein
MGHYDECREGNCLECGQTWGHCTHTKGVRDIRALQIDISEEEFVLLSKLAHERNITFNKLCNDILRECMEKEDKSFTLYQKNIRDQHIFEIHAHSFEPSDYISWLEQKLYDNDVPIKE